MKIYETTVKLRRVMANTYNGYETHDALEKLLLEGAGIKTNYTHFLHPLRQESSAEVLIRTIEPTNLPSEVCKTLKFNHGDKVRFLVRFLPYKNVFIKPESNQKRRRVFLNDPIDREVKLLTHCERAGLDVDFIDEHAITSTEFNREKVNKHTPKPWSKFVLKDVTYVIDATITNTVAFEKAYIEGLCPKTNFGYGMIVILERNDD